MGGDELVLGLLSLKSALETSRAHQVEQHRVNCGPQGELLPRNCLRSSNPSIAPFKCSLVWVLFQVSRSWVLYLSECARHSKFHGSDFSYNFGSMIELRKGLGFRVCTPPRLQLLLVIRTGFIASKVFNSQS